LAYVVPKVSGVVWQIQKTVGNSVEKGELLAIIESPDIAEAKALYVLAEADRETSQKILEQEECLRGISPLQDFLQARLSAEKAAIGVELAKQRLYALGLSDADIQDIEEETGEKTRFYSLKSPLKGKVLQRHLSLGEFTHRETKVFSIGNFDRIWIEMHVPSTDIGYLDEGLPVLIVSALGHEEGATICQFTPTINEETRMTTAIALVENSTGVWTPGEFVSVKIETDKTEVPLVVPRDAIQYLKGSPVVFIAHGETFTPSIVTLGRKDAHNIEILSGLQVGQHYAAHNTFCIKADYEKEEVEHHH
jgi:cobalt-zinc-cadmium efflux system membrane fusion protein